jgi:hypothetical protein
VLVHGLRKERAGLGILTQQGIQPSALGFVESARERLLHEFQ